MLDERAETISRRPSPRCRRHIEMVASYRRTSSCCPPFSYVTCALAVFGVLLTEYFLSSMTVMFNLTNSRQHDTDFSSPYVGEPSPVLVRDDTPLTLCAREDYKFPSMLLVTPPRNQNQQTGSANDNDTKVSGSARRPKNRVYGGDSRYVSLTVFGVEECPTMSKRCGKVTHPAISLLAFAEDDDSIKESRYIAPPLLISFISHVYIHGTYTADAVVEVVSATASWDLRVHVMSGRAACLRQQWTRSYVRSEVHFMVKGKRQCADH